MIQLHMFTFISVYMQTERERGHRTIPLDSLPTVQPCSIYSVVFCSGTARADIQFYCIISLNRQRECNFQRFKHFCYCEITLIAEAKEKRSQQQQQQQRATLHRQQRNSNVEMKSVLRESVRSCLRERVFMSRRM